MNTEGGHVNAQPIETFAEASTRLGLGRAPT